MRKMLKIAPYHRSEEDAREYVRKLATQFGVTNFGTKVATGKVATLDTSSGILRVDLRNEIQLARETGVPRNLQSLFDNSDPLMPPGFSLGISSKHLKATMTIGSLTQSIDAYGILEPPVDVLASDILHFRKEAVDASGTDSLVAVARAYRTYLQVSISLLDAFLGHATFVMAERKPNLLENKHFEQIRNVGSLEKRIEAWFGLCGKSLPDFGKSKRWSDFQALRRERNRYVHPREPLYSLSMKEAVQILNACREGVGGLLELLRRAAGLDERLGFIQKIKTAPPIEMV
ncbi:hypothetical protein [Hyphomicrobium sp. CS1BSMeth3]|uniref:hypothetical protein n=1 Tax=Hyphomicrobium sp. CS1BSMeth3 TaxID=1892844 RepID=UPI000930D8CD|nr:hypothetical protein [Hyphomicrobium sp. CS1BSMeth3]